ncbi:hypothetical protein AWW66_23560 [Micromonospora rosaria]|uniref:ABC3 transporter permease C-terminal domain-containing protein n=1 Tax=Micromonospora rosaria TaxID=47874 RepID=A0A136PMB1_9ACTN|nr:FtsX-like permease family protein [Micromonospora rosaria]KXK59561.1 hypothetical protein AWW66_23560 [Micromonospora rosaria]
MSVLAAARRVRAHGGQFLLLGVLALVVAALVAGVPRAANRLTDDGLREHLAEQPVAQRDLTYATGPAVQQGAAGLTRARQAELDSRLDRMPAPVRDAVAERWYLAEATPGRLTGPDLAARNLLVDFRLRAMSGARDAATLVEGVWPAEEPPAVDEPVQVALAADMATALNLRVGSQVRLAALPTGAGPAPVGLVVVGVFRPHDPAGGIWDTLPPVLRIVQPEGEGLPFNAVGLVGAGALDARAADAWPLRFSWRYRVGTDRIDVRALDGTVGALAVAQREAPADTPLTQGLDIPLRDFAAAVDRARTLLAVVAAGVLATLAGLVLLAVALAVRNRRPEFTLIRARGGTRGTAARRCLAESVLVVPPAAVLGWLLGSLVPGAPDGTAALVVAVTAVTTLALPLAALAVPTGEGGRRDLVRLSASTRRLTGEVLLVALAVLGVVLLRRRGLTPGDVDPLLVSVPVLVALAAAVLALRAYPWPLRLLSRLATGTRGAVAFLGAARAGRSAVGTPLVVVVVAVATAAFCAVVAVGIEAGRDRATDRLVPADALVTGYRLAPETADELAALAGVRAVTGLLQDPGRPLARDANGTDARIGDAAVLVVDGPELAEVARRAGRDLAVPEPLLAGGDPAAPAPAVVSPALAAALTGAGLDRSAFVQLQGQRYEFRVAGTVESFPLVAPGTERFVILPRQALPTRTYPAVPTGFLLAGDDLDPAEVRRVGDEGQRRFQSSGSLTGLAPPLGVTVTTWVDLRGQRGAGGANGVLAFGFLAGAAGGTVFGLLAIAFTVLAGARARGQALSRLRTLGLSRRQWQGLLLIELVPLVGASVLTGALVGALLPVLLAPLLGLSAFTGGPVPVTFDPGLVAAVLGLGAVALGLAVAVEALNSRRTRLAEALRTDRGEAR